MLNHLSALDALFLYLETPQTPMHVGSLILMEKPRGHQLSFYKNIRHHVASRMHLAPLFSRKLAFMPFDLANPIWVDADTIDLDWHIQWLELPKPGTRVQLEAAVAKRHEGMLDRDRPLWQFTVIEGLESGEVAFYAKIHHAGLDGQGGVALAHAVLDIEPKPAAREKSTAEKSASRSSLTPSAARMISAAFRTSVAQYGKILKAVPGAVKMVGGLTVSALSASQAKKLGAPSEQLTGVIDSAANLANMAASVATLKATDTPLQAAKKLLRGYEKTGIKLGPRTPLNVAIGGKRAFATARLPLDETKAIARHFEVKLNDVVLATCAGALRRYFANDKAELAKAMVSAVPASLRAAGDTSQNNQVTMMLINLATNIADPIKRMDAIKASSQNAKMMTGAMKGVMSTATSDLPTLGIPWLMSILTPLYKTAVATNRIPVVANVVISNVPGPPMPLYMAGAKMTSYYPVSIVTHGLALNITIHSYAGMLDYGFIAAKDEVPKLDKLVGMLRAAHEELLALAVPPARIETAVKIQRPKARSNVRPNVRPKASSKAAPKALAKSAPKPTSKSTRKRTKPALARAATAKRKSR
ncbi:MAG: wax ester/triacylglycerol synthase family O-acyltransferase [Rhodocyclaceae bacterium]|nr:wax ester/triacylglycerol synthase family O-acyltransferase [Rhodocyclaceae bacterium]